MTDLDFNQGCFGIDIIQKCTTWSQIGIRGLTHFEKVQRCVEFSGGELRFEFSGSRPVGPKRGPGPGPIGRLNRVQFNTFSLTELNLVNANSIEFHLISCHYLTQLDNDT